MKTPDASAAAATLYLHLRPEAPPPELHLPRPFRCVLVLESDVGAFWQAAVSDWLVASGCLYAMAVGEACSTWDDAIDMAVLERFEFGDIPEENRVTTTWHEHDTLGEVFEFAKRWANHPTEHLAATLMLHIAAEPHEAQMLEAFAAA